VTSVPVRPTSSAVLAEVRAHLPELRPSEHRIAEALIADPESFATLSIAEIADLAGTSTTTVVRFTRRIGYERFKDFRHDLTEQNLRERLAHAEAGVPASDISPTDSMEDIVAKIAANESLSVADTAAALDVASLEQAVQAMTRADRIDLYGVGASAIVALDLQRKLTRIGRIALEWPEAHAAWTAATVLNPQSAALAISHSGATTDTIEFLRLAKDAGATTIAITNHQQSDLAESADIVLRTTARETALRSGALGSRIAQLMVADCLFIGVAQANYETSVAALRRSYAAVSQRSPHR